MRSTTNNSRTHTTKEWGKSDSEGHLVGKTTTQTPSRKHAAPVQTMKGHAVYNNNKNTNTKCSDINAENVVLKINLKFIKLNPIYIKFPI